MTSAQDMGAELTGLLGVEVPGPFTLAGNIQSLEKALVAGRFLRLSIDEAESGVNAQFCPSGAFMLRVSYNDLCEKFPQLTNEVGPKYDVSLHPFEEARIFASLIKKGYLQPDYGGNGKRPS